MFENEDFVGSSPTEGANSSPCGQIGKGTSMSMKNIFFLINGIRNETLKIGNLKL